MHLRRSCLISYLLLVIWLCCDGCGSADESNQLSNGQPQQAPKDCLKAAVRLLGSKAEILHYGDVSKNGKIEAVAIARLAPDATVRKDILVSRAMILRREGSEWSVVLDATEQIKNEQGYIGLDYIDESSGFYGYRLSLDDRRGDDQPAFTIYLTDLGPDKEPQGAATEINWNPNVGRYQEFSYGDYPAVFKPEVKNPPRLRPGLTSGRKD
jgi:hypothetical protein